MTWKHLTEQISGCKNKHTWWFIPSHSIDKKHTEMIAQTTNGTISGIPNDCKTCAWFYFLSKCYGRNCFDTHWSNALIFPNQTLWRCYAAEKPDGCAATWKMYVLTPEAIAMAESDNSSPNIRKLNLSVITQLEFRANVVVRFIFRMLPSRRWVFPFKTTQEP